jgi:hypothetical protein
MGAWTGNTNFFNVINSGTQIWTVPRTAVYSFTVAGSVGGSCSNCPDDLSAGYSFTAQIALDQGETLQFVVGQTPETGRFEAGGGGATFVLSSNGQSALFIAGGGGGQGFTDIAGQPAQGLSASSPVGGAGGSGLGDGFPGLPGQGGAGGSPSGRGGANGGGGGGGGTLGEASVSWSLVPVTE